jgi:hypothetical protein
MYTDDRGKLHEEAIKGIVAHYLLGFSNRMPFLLILYMALHIMRIGFQWSQQRSYGYTEAGSWNGVVDERVDGLLFLFACSIRRVTYFCFLFFG